MSALGDVAAAILPPEAGGPEPERIAAVSRRMVSRMPAISQAGLAAALVGLESCAVARTGRRFRNLPSERREALLGEIGRAGGSVLVDTVKSIVLLANGADAFREEIATVGSRHEPSRPDATLNLVPAEEWPATTSCDVVVVGS